jgi:hypothetical protein
MPEFHDPMDDPVEHPLLGQQVTITLDRDDPAGVIRGRLVSLTAGGECVVDTEDGRRYGWPALEIEAGDMGA